MQHASRSPVASLDHGAPSVAGAVAQFALTGFLVLMLFLAGSLLVFRNLGRTEALRDARQFAVLSGQGIVEPALRDGVLRADPAALRGLDQIVQERVLGERVVRVKIWDGDGRILYSDEPRLIGSTLPPRQLQARSPRHRRDTRRAEQPRRPGEPVRTRGGQPVRGLPSDPRAGRDAAAVRDLPAQQRGRLDRAADLAPVRRAAARQPRPPLARTGAARLASRQPASPQPAGSRGAPRPGRRGFCGRATAHRRRPPRRRRPGPRRHLLLAQRGSRQRRLADVAGRPLDAAGGSDRHSRQHAAHQVAPRRDPSAEPPGIRARGRAPRPRVPASFSRDRGLARGRGRARAERGDGAPLLSRGRRGDPQRRASRGCDTTSP